MTWYELYLLGSVLYSIFATYHVCDMVPRGPLPTRIALVHAFAGLFTVLIAAALWPYFLTCNIINTVFDR